MLKKIPMLSREERLVSAAHYLATRDQLPVFPRHVQDVMRAADGDDAALDHVISVVESSVGLSTLVLRETNFAATLRNGRRVSTVRRAVSTLGLWNVRDLAASLNGGDPFQRRPPSVRSLVLRANLTAAAARNLALARDPDFAGEAQVCGMFRSCGELLIATFLPELYEEIQMRLAAGQENLDSVCMDVLQFTYDDVGQRVARLWNWPEHMIRALRAKRPLAFVGGAGDFLHTVTGCAHGLIDAAQSVGSAAEVERVAHQYGPVLELPVQAFRDIVRKSFEETMWIWSGARVPLDAKKLRRQLELAAGTELAPWTVEVAPLAPAALPEAAAAPDNRPAERSPEASPVAPPTGPEESFAFPQPPNAPQVLRY